MKNLSLPFVYKFMAPKGDSMTTESLPSIVLEPFATIFMLYEFADPSSSLITSDCPSLKVLAAGRLIVLAAPIVVV